MYNQYSYLPTPTPTPTPTQGRHASSQANPTLLRCAGLLKGTTPAQFEQLRQHFLEKVDAMFPAKKRSKKGPSLPQKGTLKTHLLCILWEGVYT